MLSSIHPFGERSRNSRWSLTVGAYLVASAVGGSATGAIAGGVGELTLSWLGAPTALVILGAAALVATAIDGHVVRLRPPGPRRQVNERWLMAYRGWVYGLGFGFQLGLGVATIVTTMTLWLAWLAALLTGSWVYGTVIGATFGTVRALAILAGAGVDDPAALRRLHRRIARHAPGVRHMTTMTAGLTAVTALSMGLR